MSSFWYEIIVYLCEGLISGTFLLNMLTPKYRRLTHLILWSEVIITMMFLTPPFSLVRIGAIAIVEIIYVMLMFEEKNKQKILVFIFKQFIALCSSFLSYSIYTKLANGKASILRSCTSDNCTYCLLYLLIFSVLISIIFQFVKQFRGLEVPWVVGTQLVIGVGECVAIIAVARSSEGIINSVESEMIIVATVCMIVANISIGVLAPYLLQRISMDTNENYAKELSNMEYKYYEIAVENEKKIKAIRHDISNQIQTVYSLLKNGENQKGMELVNELKKQYEYVNQIVYCKNPVVNIILLNKRTEAEKYGVETHIKVKEDLENIPFSDYDLSTIICNLLDNAVRGCICSEQSHPRMVIEILQKNNYLVVRVLNSCKVSMNIESTDRIATTKENTQTHGMGMPIVAGIAKKYNGDFVVSAQNGIFTATVVLSMK